MLQLCLTLWDPLDCSLPGSFVHGVLEARVLEWVTLPFSRGSSHPRDRTHISYVSCIDKRVLYHWCHLGSPCSSKGLPFPAWKFSKLLLLRFCSSAHNQVPSLSNLYVLCFVVSLDKDLKYPSSPPPHPFYLRRYYCLLADI